MTAAMGVRVAARLGLSVAVLVVVVMVVAVTAALIVVVAVRMALVVGVLVTMGTIMVLSLILVVPMPVAAARAAHAARPVSAAHRPFLITRAKALRNAEPRHVALVHSRFLPKVTQSLNSL
ncbi:hypothetical protein [Paraburkholderia guartelaensis]|uniref:hypothetical protein n=1 Tax=Paraburkholderia guartelaensis TaxID=2546446 RepID=UPI00387A3811